MLSIRTRLKFLLVELTYSKEIGEGARHRVGMCECMSGRYVYLCTRNISFQVDNDNAQYR